MIRRIHGKIVQLETVTQSQEMRKRYRYLSHFSLTTTFQVVTTTQHIFNLVINIWGSLSHCISFLNFQLCEIDLSDSLPRDAFSPFIDEIKNREKQRKRVARKVRTFYRGSFYLVYLSVFLISLAPGWRRLGGVAIYYFLHSK